MSYSRGGIPYGLPVIDRSYYGAPIHSGVPVLDQDWNVMNRITADRLIDLQNRLYSSFGWVTEGDYGGYGDNIFTLEDGVIYINGFFLDWKGVNSASNLITLPSATIGSARYDLVFVEFWMEEITGSDTIYKYGNKDYYTTNWDNDIVDPAIGEAAVSRFQYRYRTRYLVNAVDLDNALCYVQGKKSAPDSSKTWTWDGTKRVWYCNAGGDFDDLTGYVYALAICKVERPDAVDAIIAGRITDMKSSYGTSYSPSQSRIQPETTDTTLTVDNLGNIVRMNSAFDRTITLPSVGSSEDGRRITVMKLGAGKVTIQAADTDKIIDSSAGGTIYDDMAAEIYAVLVLEYVHSTTTWVSISGTGSWTTT